MVSISWAALVASLRARGDMLSVMAADKIEWQSNNMTGLERTRNKILEEQKARADMAEATVRNMQVEIQRLRREINALKTGPFNSVHMR